MIRILPINFSSLSILTPLLPRMENLFDQGCRIEHVGLDMSQFFNPARCQYDANEIILELNKRGRAQDKIMAVTDVDLFIPILNYIFGQAYLGGKVAIVSSFRLSTKRYGLPDDGALLEQRLHKCLIHELGHSFGLKHCFHPGCVMVSTTYVEEMDQKNALLCDKCMESLIVNRREL